MNESEIQTLLQDVDLLGSESPDTGNDEPSVISATEHRDRVIAFSLTGVALVLTLVGGITLGIRAAATPTSPSIQAVAQLPIEVSREQPTKPNPYEKLGVKAASYIVYDVRADKALASHNASTTRPLASLTKVMTSLVAIESSTLDARLAISEYAIDTEGDSGLYANETWKLRDLVAFTMLTSSNDGADAIAASVGGLFETTPEIVPAYEKADIFVERMNTRAHELGFTDMFFRNATGLDEPGSLAGGQGSAESMAKLLTYTWEHAPAAVESTTRLTHTYISEDGYAHPGENTNEYIFTTPGLLASKTGYTDTAGGNLAILYNSGLDHPIAIVVLGSSREGRFTDVDMLVDATYDYIESGWYEYEMAGSTPEGVGSGM